MSFSNTQIRKLQRDVKACDVRTREVNGKELSYIEGWHAIAEANRIFGFDGWSRETVEHRCLVSREKSGSFHALYVAKVRITVRTEAETVIREGFGTGDAQAPTAGEAHDKAIKTAETDATKRAFATFGKPFGLSLYLGGRKRAQEAPDIQRRRTLQRLGPNGRYYPAPRPSQNLPDVRMPSSPLNGHANGGALPNAGNGADESTAPPNADDRPRQPEQTAPSAAVPASAISANNPETSPPQRTAAVLSANEVPALQASLIDTMPPKEDIAQSVANPTSDVESLLLIDRPKRRRDPKHLQYISSQPCLICSRTPSDAHHLKFAQPKAMAKKVSDEFTVPLCRTHHRQLHQAGNEVEWWIDLDIDPLPIARDLWDQSKTRKADGQDGE
jgi:hypothetical protein